MPKPTKGGFYAVMEGRKPGVYLTWEDCEAQVKGYPNPKFKKFTNAAEAESFVKGSIVPAPLNDGSGKQNSSHSIAVSSYDKGKKRGMSPDIEDESDWTVVYSDGACKGNGKAGSVAGVGVWWGVDDPRNIAERCPGDQTNNRAELIAILRILETAPRTKKPLLIKSDSQYSIKCFRDWLPGWQRNGWIKSGGDPVKNADIIRYLSAHLDARARFGQKIRLQYVKGHSGDQGNDGADAQANLGALLPPEPEKDWKKLEEEFNKRIEEEWQNERVKPSGVAMEIEGDNGEIHNYESAIKVRKTGQDMTSEQHPQTISKPLVAPTLPISTTPVTAQLLDSSKPQSPDPPRKVSGFKPSGIAISPPRAHEAAKTRHTESSVLTTTPSTPTTNKQTNQLIKLSNYFQIQEPKITPPGTPSYHTTTSRDIASPMKPSNVGSELAPLRKIPKELAVTPRRPTRTVPVQTTPIAKVKTPMGHSSAASIVVNKEDIDFSMFEDCAIDDEDMWQDLWP